VAHEAAVVEAMAYLEREACGVRRGHGGAIAMRGRGFVAAAFGHRTSRAGDPLLHTHVVVGNVTQGDDGRWSALDGRLLYRHAKTAGFLYQAALRAELTDRLQVRWNAVERGNAAGASTMSGTARRSRICVTATLKASRAPTTPTGDWWPRRTPRPRERPSCRTGGPRTRQAPLR
jgi:hypothetical protein